MTAFDSSGPIRHMIVTSLGSWARAWDELVAQADIPSPFLRSWWLDAVPGRSSMFVLVVEEDSLIGGLALERRRRILGVPVYQFSGSGKLSPDHLDMLAARGKESVVSRAVVEWFRQPGSRVLDLDGVVEHSLLEATFGSAATSVVDVAPWDELPADADEFFSSLSTNVRSVVRRAQRRLAVAGITHHCITNSTDEAADRAEAALRAFVGLQQQRGDRAALLRETPRLKRALIAGLAAGEVQIHTMESADRVVLVSISFHLGGAVRVYQTARLLDHEFRNASAVALLEEVRQACADGYHELDMLRGGEPYKDKFVHGERALKRLRVAHGARGILVLASLKAVTRCRGVAGKLRRRLRTRRAERAAE